MKKRLVRFAYCHDKCCYGIQFKFSDGDNVWKTDCSYPTFTKDGIENTDTFQENVRVCDDLLWKFNNYILNFGCQVEPIKKYETFSDMWNCKD